VVQVGPTGSSAPAAAPAKSQQAQKQWRAAAALGVTASLQRPRGSRCWGKRPKVWSTAPPEGGREAAPAARRSPPGFRPLAEGLHQAGAQVSASTYPYFVGRAVLRSRPAAAALLARERQQQRAGDSRAKAARGSPAARKGGN